MALIEDEKIGLEYEIINDVISIRRVYVKDSVKVEDKPFINRFGKYEYVSNYERDSISGVILEYSDFKKDEFTLKISGADIPNLNIQKLLVWVSDEYVDKVEILEDNTGLRVYLDDFLEEGETFSLDFFEAFSREILRTILDVKNDGLVDFCGSMANMFTVESYDRFKQLITYIDKALI